MVRAAAAQPFGRPGRRPFPAQEIVCMASAAKSASRPLQPAIDIRAAELPDAEIILDMIHRLAASQGAEARVHATIDHLRRDLFGVNKRVDALIAERGGVPVGLALFQELYSTWDAQSALMINDLFVDEAVRGMGVGRALMKAIGRAAKTRGCGSVSLNVIHTNRNASFFDQLGFSHQDDLLSYRLDASVLASVADAPK
jgi:predicted N-acetyltransferase YhbS